MTTKQQLAKEFDEKFPYLYRNLLERSRESDWEYQNDKIHLFLDQAYDRIEAETAKAFGGCTNCYGKGYHTTKQAVSGRHFYKELSPYHPCDKCDRGQQIAEMHDRIREEALREADEAMQLALYKAEKQDPRWAPVRLRGWAHCKRVALEAIHSLITKK